MGVVMVKCWKGITLCLRSKNMDIREWASVLPESLHALRLHYSKVFTVPYLSDCYCVLVLIKTLWINYERRTASGIYYYQLGWWSYILTKKEVNMRLLWKKIYILSATYIFIISVCLQVSIICIALYSAGGKECINFISVCNVCLSLCLLLSVCIQCPSVHLPGSSRLHCYFNTQNVLFVTILICEPHW